MTAQPIAAAAGSILERPSRLAGRAGRLEEIDRAKGILILLVVYGHVAEMPAEAPWYVLSKDWLYSFHMPCFMFLSGLLFFLKDWQRIVDAPAYFRFVRRRATRLLPGYFVIGFGVVFAKLLAAPFLQVDNPPGDLVSALADVVFRPFQSASRGVWFIETLLLMTILAMPFLALFGNRLALALAAAVVIHFIPAPQFLALSQLTSFAIFFLLGAVAADNYDRLLDLGEKNGVLLLGGFLGFSLFVMAMLPPSLHQLLIGVAATPVCLALAAGRNPLAGRDWTLYLGRWSYSIYLFNTLAIGLAKALLLKVFPWTSATIPFFAIVLTTVGVLVPCLLGSLVLGRFSVTRNLT